MKRFINIELRDKEYFKMINQSEKGFDLIITSESHLEMILNFINSNNQDDFYIIWQQKFKRENSTLYKNCIFSEPVDNFIIDKTIREKTNYMKKCGKKITVVCSDVSYYTSNKQFINKKVKFSTHYYKDSKLLTRMLKIVELSGINNN